MAQVAAEQARRLSREKQVQDRRAWSGMAGAARFGGAWIVSARAGAKRHMPNLHTARPHLQLQCCGIAIEAIAQFNGIFATSRN